MSRLTIISDKEMIKLLHRLGFNEIRQNGSHIFLQHPDARTTVVPIHGKDLKRGLIKAILKDINLSDEEYEKTRK